MVLIKYDKTENGSYTNSTHFSQFKALFQAIRKQDCVLVPVNEELDNKEPLLELDDDLTTVKCSSLEHYCVFKNPWVPPAKRGELKFVVKVRMPHVTNVPDFSDYTQILFR